MGDFISTMFKSLIDKWSKIKEKVSILFLICLFLIFLKQNDVFNNSVFIALEKIFLWLRECIINFIPIEIVKQFHIIVDSYYQFIFRFDIGFIILLLIFIRFIYNKLYKKFFSESKEDVWKRMKYLDLINITFGSGYVLSKIIEFISLGKNTVRWNSYEILILLLHSLFILLYILQFLFGESKRYHN